MVWQTVRTGRYPIVRFSKERHATPVLHLKDSNRGMPSSSGRLVANIAWFDQVSEARYVRISVDTERRRIRLEPKKRPVIDARKVRYKNGEVYIGGGKLIKDLGMPFGKYVQTGKNVFTFDTNQSRKGEPV